MPADDTAGKAGSFNRSHAGRTHGHCARKELQMETRERAVPILRIEMNGNRFSPVLFPTFG
jgi:hypothetical protein